MYAIQSAAQEEKKKKKKKKEDEQEEGRRSCLQALSRQSATIMLPSRSLLPTS